LVVVGGLLAAALVVGMVLWVTMGTSTGGTLPPPSTNGGTAATSAAQTTATPGPVGIASLRSFDPDGDGKEQDGLIGNATDSNLATSWSTVCYGSKYLGGKGGVGLIADLGHASTGMFTVAIGSAPYQLRVYGSSASKPPASFADWGTPLGSFNGTEPQTVSTQITDPARWVLVSFVELGRDPSCTSNPYRGSIQELSFT
jgi:hypothetical protein